MSSHPDILLLDPLPEATIAQIKRSFTPHEFTTMDALIPLAPRIRAVTTGGGPGVSSDVMAALPNLEIIAVNGVGTDRIDLEEVRRRNIKVTTTPGVLSLDVADMAIALLLALKRQIIAHDRFIRTGDWAKGNPPLAHSLTGLKMGVVGFGFIGQAIAKRAVAFDMDVAYFNSRPRSESTFRFEPDLRTLADWCDVLVLAVPGGPRSANMINADILNALGPDGVLINIARGSVVDEAALLQALKERKIAGAGLDVFQNEPGIDPAFLTLENTVLQPHQASATVETRLAMGQLVLDNLLAHFTGKPLLTPLF